jgi:Tol biopolymer transport system component
VLAKINRRQFLTLAALSPAMTMSVSCRHPMTAHSGRSSPPARFFFTSQGRTALMNADGTGLRYFDFKVPNQTTWQPGPFLSDGRRVVFLSMEPRRDGPGKPFEEYYTQTPTHLWLYDLDKDSLTEIATRDRLAVFYTPALLVSDERILVQIVRNKVGQIFSMNLDGTGAREFTRAGEGLPYGLSLSPDGRRVAFHLASPRGYEIWTCDAASANRVRIIGHSDHLYFGTSWSPDGQWILYQDCHFKSDPGHDWSDICIGRTDGSEHRVLTSGQAQWFGATYGNAQNRGGGSNMPVWTRDGQILFSRKLAGSKVAWEFQPQRPDTDHFNRDFKPDLARGGTEICRLNPQDGSMTPLTQSEPPVWDFRASESSDGKQIVFCRAETGGPPAIWVMDSDGRHPRMITRGLNDKGADHPRWLPQRLSWA